MGVPDRIILFFALQLLRYGRRGKEEEGEDEW
jgi:hypothetical protein